MAQHIGYRFDGSYFHLSCMGRVVSDILQDEYGVAPSAFPMLATKQNVRLWAKMERKRGSDLQRLIDQDQFPSEIFGEDFSCLHCEVGGEHPHGEEKCTHDYCGWCGDPIVLPD